MAERTYHRSSWSGGTANWYSYAPLAPWLLLTDGIKETCETLQCWWVVDIIASIKTIVSQSGDLVHDDWFRVVKVHLQDSGASFFLEDGDNHVLYQQNIEFTDLTKDLLFFLRLDGGFNKWVLLMPEEN